MWAIVKRFLTDGDYFIACMRSLTTYFRGSNAVRGALLALGAALATGTINLGGDGWWAGWASIALSGFIKAGDKNMTPEQLAQAIENHLANKNVEKIMKPADG